MAELTATSKAELQKMGVLPGHANLLLQCARKHSDAQLAPKQPKASSAPRPAPTAVGFFVGRSVLYTRGNGATVRAKVGMANMISSSNRMAMMWSAFLCLGPNCELHR